MPSISQPFRLASLPRLTALSDVSLQTEQIQVADDLTPASNKITVGVSESAISQYILNPTPKLVLSIPISSTNIVTACEVSQFVEGNEENNAKHCEIWCYASKAGKNNMLNIIINDMDAEKALKSAGELANAKKVKVKEEIVSIKVKNKSIVVVLKSGLIQWYDFDLKLTHSLDISYGNVRVVNHFEENEQYFMFVLCALNDDKVCFKLFELSTNSYSNSPCKELSSIILEDFSLERSKICYESGKLYRLVDDQIITYSLPQCQILQKVKIPLSSDSQAISMKPISPNRILLTMKNTIYLLDLIHNSILSERELTHVKTFQLLRTAVINSKLSDGNTSNKTIAIGVATKQGPNPSSYLEMISVDVGTGTLKDSLGKSFQSVNKSATSHSLKPLFEIDEQDDIVGDDEDKSQENFDFDKIYQQLIKCKNSISNFDGIFLNELNIKKEHYTEDDRFICDPEFLSKVVHLIFDNFEREYPKALTFLLTHPLFPVKCTKNLLSRFREHPRLFKQTIVTCPNLPLNELLFELFSIQNGELSLDISLRILQDYTTDMMRDQIKKLSKIEVQNYIEFVMSSKDTETVRNGHHLFQLLSLLLDSIGLLALEGTTLDRLSDYIDEQVAIAERNSKLWYLLDDRQSTRRTLNSSRISSNVQKESMPRYTVEYLDI